MSFVYCLNCTLPTQACICQFAPKIKLAKPCALLIHPREYSKRSNTGRLLKLATNAQCATWHRLKNEQLARKFQGYALLYPDAEVLTAHDTDNPQNIKKSCASTKGVLILDATWQESRKMLRQSPWLAQLPRISLDPPASSYRLRRNQNVQGLSTLESMAYWLFEQNQRNCGLELLEFLNCFQSAYLKARQAGQLK